VGRLSAYKLGSILEMVGFGSGGGGGEDVYCVDDLLF